MEFNWKKIELSDKDVIQGYYRRAKLQNCESTFANNYLWAPHYKIRYTIIEGMLAFLSDEERPCVSFPLGEGDLKKTMDTILTWFEERERPFKMNLVNPSQFALLEELYPDKFQIEYNRDYSDYVYESEKLLTLSGKRLHGKRNHINKFKETYPDWSYEAITSENTQECLEMAQEWRIRNGCDEDEAKDAEFCVTLKALKLREELELKGGLLRADGRVVAFTLGEPGSGDTFIVHIEKAFADVQGAYPMINQQFVEHEAAGYPYVNREEDTGAEGLRKAKLSYRPVMLQKKGIIRLK